MSNFLQSIQSRRAERFFAPPRPGIHRPEEALQFIDEMGFCLFSYIPEVELPCLSRIVCQDEGEQPDTWGWKDSLPAARQVYYGAVFHPTRGWAARPGFISLQMLAPLYALAPILQFGGDLSMMRRYFKISQEAILIADILNKEGSLSTGDLRASTGLTGKTNSAKFSRGLAEAQSHFLVTKLGVTSITRANYGYIWGTFAQVFPEIAQQAEMIPETAAARAIVQQYVQTALAVPLERISAMLALDLRFLQPAAAHLVAEGTLILVEDEGIRYLTVR